MNQHGPPQVAVIGAGITGLAAALQLRDRLGNAATITVWDKDPTIGGKLRTGSIGGVNAEQGADAFLMRKPGSLDDSAAVALARRLELALVHPRALPPAIVGNGQLLPIPGGTLLGIPGDLDALGQVAQVEPATDFDDGRTLLAADQDVTVGHLVRQRFGDQVVDRLVDPMLGGVYAGRADELSLATTMPGLAAACRTETTLIGAVRAALAAAPRPTGAAVFGSVRGGLGRLVEATAAASGAQLRLGLPVRALSRHGNGWQLVVGSTRDPDYVTADAVVLALPSRPAARLLQEVTPAAAAQVATLDYASVALVTLALPVGTALPPRSGFLVPATEQTTIKAATFLTRKWPHLHDQTSGTDQAELVRMSVGRHGESQALRLADEELAARAHQDLCRIVGTLPAPDDWQVQRWGGALPQYAPRHLDRVAAARAALPDTLRLAGAGYDGVGIPACIGSGQTAADQVVASLQRDGARMRV